MGIEAENGDVFEADSATSIEGRLPSLIKIFWDVNDDTKLFRDFFRETKGAMAVSEAHCITHKVCRYMDSHSVTTDYTFLLYR